MSKYMHAELAHQFSDTPNHQEGQTSSIGSIWPPHPDSFERIKAFYNLRPVMSERSLCVLEQQFLRQAERLDGTLLSRLQFRVVMGDVFLKNNSGGEFLQNYVEAVIPLERKYEGENLVLVYLGSNHLLRPCSSMDLEAIRTNYLQASITPSRNVAEIFERAISNGFTVEIVDKSQNQNSNIAQLANLYARFGWTLQEVDKMYRSPNNVIAVARNKGAIISAGLAEIAQIKFVDGPLNLVEITEAATLSDYGNQGLYTAVSTKLLIEMAKLSHSRTLGSEIDLVFGECNALSLAVLTAVKRQGRIFAAEVAQHYGFPGRGLLLQQVPISGPTSQTSYNDLLPAFLTPSQLYSRYLNSE